MSVVNLLLRNYKFCTDGKSPTVPVRRDCIIELPQGKVNTVEFVVLNEQVLGISSVDWHLRLQRGERGLPAENEPQSAAEMTAEEREAKQDDEIAFPPVMQPECT